MRNKFRRYSEMQQVVPLVQPNLNILLFNRIPSWNFHQRSLPTSLTTFAEETLLSARRISFANRRCLNVNLLAVNDEFTRHEEMAISLCIHSIYSSYETSN